MLHTFGHGGPANPHAAGTMLEHVRKGATQVQLSQTLLVVYSHHNHFGVGFSGHIYDSRSRAARLNNSRFDLQPHRLRELFGVVKGLLAFFYTLIKLCVQRQRLRHFHYVYNIYRNITSFALFGDSIRIRQAHSVVVNSATLYRHEYAFKLVLVLAIENAL